MENSFTRGPLERRRYPRLSATNDNALIVLPEENLSGTLIDISMGGVSFYYSGNPFELGSILQQGILVGEDDLWLENIPLRTVRDFVVRMPLLNSASPIRRRCLQFGDLTQLQRAQLSQFIWLNTEK